MGVAALRLKLSTYDQESQMYLYAIRIILFYTRSGIMQLSRTCSEIVTGLGESISMTTLRSFPPGRSLSCVRRLDYRLLRFAFLPPNDFDVLE